MPDLTPADLVNMVREPEPTVEVDRATTEETSITFFLEELRRFKRPGVNVEVWGNEPPDNVA